ncbi:(deoxy)nucleoside triphosphate pyrophosphohydrolase [Pilimelia columellifera]|uniref:8-oxo-dGTP diphosphatase n=1 Tax=Pilimelia columellifera subsp. columellifera TaxID=706583 RepID=A0ABN3N5Y9_9ACTN
MTVIVGAAIIADGRVLACERAQPAALAGQWEFPGGKVDPGESETEALIRECVEELEVTVIVGDRVGADIRLTGRDAVLKVFVAEIDGPAKPRAVEHSELRWLGADELDTVPWLPADAPIVDALRPLLSARAAGRR